MTKAQESKQGVYTELPSLTLGVGPLSGGQVRVCLEPQAVSLCARGAEDPLKLLGPSVGQEEQLRQGLRLAVRNQFLPTTRASEKIGRNQTQLVGVVVSVDIDSVTSD